MALHVLQCAHAEVRNVLSKHLYRAGARLVEADDGSQKDGFAGTRSADNAQHLAAIDVEIDVIMDHMVAEAVHEPSDADDDFVGWSVRHDQIFRIENRIENPASRTMMRKIDSTTERVVSLPTLAALRST